MKLSLFASLVALLLTCSGCAFGLEVGGKGRVVRADDGYPLLTYRFSSDPDEPNPRERARVFYFQGSRAGSVIDHIGALAGFAAMDMSIVAAELRGVRGPREVDEVAVARAASKRRRVADGRLLLDAYLEPGGSHRPVIVVGASEGGDVAAAVAAGDRRVTHLILLGTGGGWSQAEELRFLVRAGQGGLRMNEAELDAGFAAIRAAPDSDTLWLGHTHRRWSSYLWSPPIDDLRRTDVPILMVHGGRDQSVPIGSARAARDDFTRRGKGNLRLVEHPSLDHRFHDATGRSGVPLVELDVVRYLADTGVLREEEAGAFRDRVVANHPEWFSDQK